MAKRVDSGEGQLIVLLHGIGRTGSVWKHLVNALQDLPVRVVAFDLLGFGDSPKPKWLSYSVDDHVQAVVASIERLHPEKPVIVVGHSMGCLVAVRLARQRPDLVAHLVLYEMPLYKGLPNTRLYRLRLNFYTKLYNWILEYEPSSLKGRTPKLSEIVAHRFFKLGVDQTSWQPYVKSLQHTIFEQTTPEDIPNLSMPMDVIYGSFDMLVIRGTVQHVYGEAEKYTQVHTVRAGHRITRKASQFLRERIVIALALQPSSKQPPKAKSAQ